MVHVQVGLVRTRLIGDIPFVVDTGAERSLLGHDHADEIGVDYDLYGRPDASVGGIFLRCSVWTFSEGSGWCSIGIGAKLR